MPLPNFGANSDVVIEKVSQGVPASPTDINPIRSLDDIAYVGSQVLNQGNIAEGSTLPPSQNGEFRVPRPSGFEIKDIQQNFVGSLITFQWQDIDQSLVEIALYEIYSQNIYLKNQQPTLVGSASNSPCVARIINDAAADMTFWLRPVCSSGLALPLDACPTCTVHAPAPRLQLGNNSRIVLGSGSQIVIGTAPNDFVLTGVVDNTLPITPTSVKFVEVIHNGATGYIPIWFA